MKNENRNQKKKNSNNNKENEEKVEEVAKIWQILTENLKLGMVKYSVGDCNHSFWVHKNSINTSKNIFAFEMIPWWWNSQDQCPCEALY